MLAPRLAAGPRRSYLGFVLGFEVLAIGLLSALAAIAVVLVGVLGSLERVVLATSLAALAYSNVLGLQGLSRRGFYVAQQPGRAVLQSAAFAALVALGLAALYLRGEATLPEVFAVLGVGGVGACLLSARRWQGELRAPTRLDARRHLGEHWSFGSLLLLTVPFQVGMYQGYFLISGYLLGSLATGALKAADTFVAPFDQICIGLSLLFVPRLAGSFANAGGDLHGWLRTATVRFLGLGALYSLLLVLAGPLLVVRVFTEDSRPAVSLVVILAAIPLFKALAYPPGIALMAGKRSGVILLAYLASFLATITGGVVLIRFLGLAGAAYGLVLSVAVFAAAQWIGVWWVGSDPDSGSAERAGSE